MVALAALVVATIAVWRICATTPAASSTLSHGPIADDRSTSIGGMEMAELSATGQRLDGPPPVPPSGVAEAREGAPPKHPTVWTVLVWDEFGKAIPGALVEFMIDKRAGDSRVAMRTGSDGSIAVDVARIFGGARVSRVQVLAPGYAPDVEAIGEGDPLAVRTVEFKLRQGTRVDGRTIDRVTEIAIPGVRARWLIPGGQSVELGLTDHDGRFSIPGVPAGEEATIGFDGAGYCTLEFPVRVDGVNPGRNAVVRLERGIVVSGLITEPSGAVCVGASIWREEVSETLANDEPDADDEDAVGSWIWGSDLPNESTRRDDDAAARSDARGEFRVDGVRVGAVLQLRARSKDAQLIGSAQVDVAATQRVSIPLGPSAHIRTRILGVDSSTPRSGIRVRLANKQGVRESSVELTESAVEFDAVEPGGYIVSAMAPGCPSVSTRVVANSGRVAQVDLHLELGRRIDGIVEGPDGHPVAGATVVIGRPDDDGDGPNMGLRYAVRTVSDAVGRFAFDGLRQGKFGVQARVNDRDVHLATLRTERLNAPASNTRIRLSRLGSIRARLMTPTHSYFVGVAGVGVDESGEGLARNPVYEGRIALGPLQDGRYRVRIEPEGYAWIDRDVTISGGASIDLADIQLLVGSTISGRVIDSENRGVSGAIVGCLDAMDYSVQTSEDGSFRLSNVPSGARPLIGISSGALPGLTVVDAASGADHSIRVVLPVRVSGRVRRQDGAAVGVTQLQFLPVPRPPYWDRIRFRGLWSQHEVQTDRNGAFELIPVAPGEVEVIDVNATAADVKPFHFKATGNPIDITVNR